jgi:hypothetical protein
VTEPWLMRVEGALAAHFKQESGPSRPGVEWAIGLKHGDKTYAARVRAYLAADATAETRADQDYQARTVMQYLNDLIAKGWHPDQTREHLITIGNPLAGPPGAPQAAAKKPWWRLW